MEGSSYSNADCDEVSGSVTPSQKQELLKFELQSLNADLPPTDDGDNSSVASLNEGSESPLSSSSWDSEPETDIPSLINCDGMLQGSLQSINLEENYLDIEEQNQFVGVENSDDGLLWEMDNRSYDDLLNKFLEKEEELRLSNFGLKLLEQGNINLKDQVENSEAQLDNVREELKLKEEELRKQRELSEVEISKLKIQIEKSENQLDNVNGELKRKEEELEIQDELWKKNILNLKNQIDKSEHWFNIVNKELKQKKEELKTQKEFWKKDVTYLKFQIEKRENQLNNANEGLKLKEEELKIQKELSEEEIFKLKTQIGKSEIQLNTVNEELKLKKEELNKQKEEAPKIIADITNLLDQLEVYHENQAEQLKISKDEIAILRKELESKSSETNLLQGQLKVTQENMAKSELELVSERTQNRKLGDLVKMYEANETNHEQEVQKLKSELLDWQAKFSFDIASLSKLNMELTSKLEDCNSRNKKLENKLRQYEAEKLNQEENHGTEKIVLQDEIMSLRQELEQRMDDVEATDKKLDMVMIELVEANVIIDNFKAEICSRDDKISNMKKYNDDVKTSLKELMMNYNTALNEQYNANMRLGELEKEVTRQNGVISDLAEEKKEAIRQLSLSLEDYKNKLEHYKSAYNEIVQTLYG